MTGDFREPGHNTLENLGLRQVSHANTGADVTSRVTCCAWHRDKGSDTKVSFEEMHSMLDMPRVPGNVGFICMPMCESCFSGNSIDKCHAYADSGTKKACDHVIFPMSHRL